MGRSRGASSSSSSKKKKGLSCPGGACYLSSDSDCSDSDCSDCYECSAGPRKKAAKSKSKSKPKSVKSKKKSSKPKRRARDSSSSCSCSDCMDYSSDDSYNCPPARRGPRGRARNCSTC